MTPEQPKLQEKLQKGLAREHLTAHKDKKAGN